MRVAIGIASRSLTKYNLASASIPFRRISPISTCRTFSCSSRLQYVSEISPGSSLKNPAESESQRLLEIGTAALESGNFDEAIENYKRAIEIFETSNAYFNLGVCQFHLKNFDKAIESWQNVLRIHPDAADAHTNLSSAYVMATPSRPDFALKHLKEAAKITPNDAEIQFNMGAILEACEQLPEAAQAYEKALKGNIKRAEENLRNVKAKILSVKANAAAEGKHVPVKDEK